MALFNDVQDIIDSVATQYTRKKKEFGLKHPTHVGANHHGVNKNTVFRLPGQLGADDGDEGYAKVPV